MLSDCKAVFLTLFVIIILCCQIGKYGKVEGISCYVCSTKENATCAEPIYDDSFLTDCSIYTTHCATLFESAEVENRGCMGSFKCQNRGYYECCICNRNRCNWHRTCVNLEKHKANSNAEMGVSANSVPFILLMFLVYFQIYLN